MAKDGRPIRVVGISGSLRAGSYNTAALRAAIALAPEGMTIETAEIGDLPLYNDDVRVAGYPPAVQRLRDQLSAADAILFVTPEYNYSIPGVLKNAIDWASRPFPENVLRYKPTAVVGASTGLFGAVWAQAEVRKTMKASGAHVLESELPVGMADYAFVEGEDALADPELTQRFKDLLGDLVREVTAPVEAS